MSLFNVTLKPGEQHFQTSHRQDILQSALAAGINLAYGCSSGQCGKCLARLMSGETELLRHSDFVLSAQQKQQGYFVTCCYGALTDLELEVQPVDSSAEMPEQQISTKVYRLERLCDDVMAITLKTPRTQLLQFLAGQYITIDLGNGVKRNKSLANCPCDGMKPVIHVCRREHDPFSDYVFNHLKKNDSIDLIGPYGDFTLNEDAPKPLLFIAYDTGFAAIKSLVDHVVALDHELPVELVWLSTGGDKPYLDNYCRSLVDALDYFSYSARALADDSFASVRDIVAEILHQPFVQQQQPDIFITLPHGQLAEAREWLQTQAIQADQVKLNRMEWFE